MEEFFTLTSQTLDSFMKSMIEEGKRKNIDEEENQFVLAMAGTITSKIYQLLLQDCILLQSLIFS